MKKFIPGCFFLILAIICLIDFLKTSPSISSIGSFVGFLAFLLVAFIFLVGAAIKPSHYTGDSTESKSGIRIVNEKGETIARIEIDD